MRIGMMADVYKPHVSGITNYISLNKQIFGKGWARSFCFYIRRPRLSRRRNEYYPLTRPASGGYRLYLEFPLPPECKSTAADHGPGPRPPSIPQRTAGPELLPPAAHPGCLYQPHPLRSIRTGIHAAPARGDQRHLPPELYASILYRRGPGRLSVARDGRRSAQTGGDQPDRSGAQRCRTGSATSRRAKIADSNSALLPKTSC